MATLRQAVLAKLKGRGVTGISSEVVSTILDAVAEVERERAAAVKADRCALPQRKRYRAKPIASPKMLPVSAHPAMMP
jgi:hypothetical protein